MSRLAMISVIGSLAAACSTDTVRFSDNPFSNPFKTAGAAADPVRTGSINEDAPAAVPMPRSSVRSEPLAPVRTGSLAAPSAAPKTAAATSAGWSTAGGTTITVGSGDTINSISSRYGVPSTAILSANGLSSSEVAPGRRLVIPVYSATGGAGETRPVRTVETAPAASPPVGRVVSSSKIDVKKPEPRNLAEAAKPRTRPGQVAAVKPQVAKAPEPAARVDAKAPVRVAQAAPKQVAAPAKAEPKVAKVEPKPVKVEAKPEPKPVKVVKIEPPKPEAKPVRTAKAEPVKVEPAKAPAEAAKAPAKEVEATASVPAAAPAEASPGCRWPARGRVITGYGGGGSNEGINIAVPDGTPVKAAGDGVVAYAGSEVKGYGNLVLIRHDNGYVSAYAHNGDLDVKRGQKVTRGQTIAKSGQSGNVTSPQLHFEIRKGSTPVDPMRYLASAN